IASGTIRMKPQIERITQNGVKFVDGTEAQADTIIVATGYTIEFPLIEGGKLIKSEENEVNCFEFMFPMELDKTTLGIVGMIQPYGSIMPIAELQARVILDVLSGRSRLPNKEERAKLVVAKREEMASRYAASRRHTIQVDYIAYMDDLAKLIGCEAPKWFEHLPHDPKMAFATAFTPFASYFYRLRGPHPWSGARDACLTIEDRIVQATDAKGKGSPFNALKSGALHELITFIVFAILLIAALIH
ncbi:hypothetical protein PFISCL1PPCAC_27157, partial [Pristionchus fissidentatus]